MSGETSVRNNNDNIGNVEQEPDILKAEISAAIGALKGNKASGSDEIVSEMIKAAGQQGDAICNKKNRLDSFKGTREQILNVRQITEKLREFNTPSYLCFLDYQKASDCVKWEKLWSIMETLGVPPHLIYLIRNLYSSNEARVRVNDQLTGWRIHFQAMEGWSGGISINGRKISNLRYADDTTLLAASEDELVRLLERIDKASKEDGLKINASRSKILVVDGANKNQPNNRRISRIETVENLIYLAVQITNTGDCEGEIRRRIILAKTALAKLTRIWRDRGISKSTKMRLIRSLVFIIKTLQRAGHQGSG
ncbi:endonuclease-reverse transcriptase [Lasius niger]|uniref:Endonuclease-reverse transcriptase n=1 Tax=Lasius niger TaxID=67767 RepID=A0A0J7K909_LASNI|nr:endonuclease-reverse transcriptase [Lasius niger]